MWGGSGEGDGLWSGFLVSVAGFRKICKKLDKKLQDGLGATVVLVFFLLPGFRGLTLGPHLATHGVVVLSLFVFVYQDSQGLTRVPSHLRFQTWRLRGSWDPFGIERD